jgi:16S rRNA (guanine527-N7)-methyltransferase
MAKRPPRDGTLKTYVEELLRVNESVNLTGTRSFEKAWDLHVRDSLALLELKLSKPLISIDLGSGNGFPGVAIAAQYPDCRVILVERTAKKANAIADIAKHAQLDNVEVFNCDGRELLSKAPELARKAQLICARAVAPLDKLIPICTPWLDPKGRMVFWKGNKLSKEESAAGRKAARKMGFMHFKRHDYILDDHRGGCLISVF